MRFVDIMKKENIGIGIHFPSFIPGYYSKVYGYKREDFPNADFVWDRIVSIPLYPKMSVEDLRNVIDATKKIAEQIKEGKLEIDQINEEGKTSCRLY